MFKISSLPLPHPTTAAIVPFTSCGLANLVAADAAAEDLSHTVHFELGKTQFDSGDSITIQEIHGTSDAIEVGGTYSVDGTYTLNSRDEAELALHTTTISNSGSTPVASSQHVQIKKGTGTFHLVKTMGQDGYLHVSFYPLPSGSSFGGGLFRAGKPVLRDESQSSPSPVSATGPNQALLEYLGNPIGAPSDMDTRFSKEGLLNTIQTAAQNAGITVKRVNVDDSEYPFIVGVICGGSDVIKLKDQLRVGGRLRIQRLHRQ